MRTFNNSYVALPSADFRLVLPGETYLHVNSNFGCQQLPLWYFKYQADLARSRLGIGTATIGTLIDKQDRKQPFTRAEYEVVVELFADFITWPVRGVAQYLSDEIDRCVPQPQQQQQQQQQLSLGTMAQQRVSNKPERCCLKCNSSGSRLTTKSRLQLHGEQQVKMTPTTMSVTPAKQQQQQQQHLVGATDQFKGLWDALLPYLDADDCESLSISVYGLIIQFKQAVAKQRLLRRSGSTDVERLFGDMILHIYVPVMLTCSIHRSAHDRMTFKSDVEERNNDLTDRSFVFDASKPGLLDPRLICHVLLLMIPRQRLANWIARGRDYLALANQHQQQQGSGAYKNRHGNTSSIGGWPNFILDGTEYSYCRQSSTIQATREFDALATHMRDHDGTAAFWERFNRTFSHSSLCIHRNPRQRTVGYNLYLHAVSGHCTLASFGDGDGTGTGVHAGEFIFCDTKSGERGVRFADIVEGDHDSVDSTIACLPVHERPTLSREDLVHVDRITDLEPFAPLPPVSFVEEAGIATVPGEEQQQGEHKKTDEGGRHYDLFVRDQHWTLFERKFTDWIQQPQQKHLTHSTRKIIIFDGAIQWHVRIRDGGSSSSSST